MKVKSYFCDVAIACEDRIFETHKLVLATSSSIFINILRRHSHPHPMIYLRGLKASDMEALLEFMYCGEVKVKEDQLQSFLAAAQDLKVQGLISNHKKELQGNSLAKISPDWKMPIYEILQSSMENQTFKVSMPLPSLPNSTTSCEEQFKASHPNEVFKPALKEEAYFDETSMKNTPLELLTVSSFVNNQGHFYSNREKQLTVMTGMDERLLDSVEYNVREWNDLKKFVVHGERAKYGSGHKKLSQCTLCGKTNINRNRLLAHIKSVHFWKAFRFTCTSCGKSQGTRNGLIAHAKMCWAKSGDRIPQK